MNIKLIWFAPILILFLSNNAKIGRSANDEMRQIRGLQTTNSKLNMDEYWPFPEAISEADPFVIEIEKQSLGLRKES